MRTRDKEHYTYESIQAEISRLEKYMADLVIDAATKGDGPLYVNSIIIQQNVGRLKGLRDIMWK